MFTGLVEAVGTVHSLIDLGEQARLTLDLPFTDELALGDSVAVNGCCLTVAAIVENGATFDLLSQTLKVTSLGDLHPGARVNLERAMRVGDRFGGHFVQGHVDATGTITGIDASGQDHIVTVSIPENLRSLCIDKGSVAVDGISLTIASLDKEEMVFWITPHTWEHTHLRSAAVGQRANLEADMLAKHVQKLLAARLQLIH
jgi:riboflavin synthase